MKASAHKATHTRVRAHWSSAAKREAAWITAEEGSRTLTYIDGKPWPALRGVLHTVVSVLLVLGLVGLWCAVGLGVLPTVWAWALGGFLVGKALSYGASAVLHRFPFKTVESATIALQVDLSLVSAALWAPSSLVLQSLTVWLFNLAVGALFVVVNAILVRRQFGYGTHLGLETPSDKSELPRTIVIVVQWFYLTLLVGWHVGAFNGLLWLSQLLYVAAAACAVPVTMAHAVEPMSPSIPWHRKGVYGLHEDFHLLLLAADLTMLAMGLRYMLWLW